MKNPAKLRNIVTTDQKTTQLDLLNQTQAWLVNELSRMKERGITKEDAPRLRELKARNARLLKELKQIMEIK